MKRLPNIGIFAASTLIGLFISYSITIVAWNLIERRMFHCADDVGFAFFAENIEDHKSARDTLLPGWTWGEVKFARLIYLAAFFSLWFAIAAVPRWTVLRKTSREVVA